MRNYIIVAICLLLSSSLFAQNARFTPAGTIEFEKKVNMYAIIQRELKKGDENNSFAQQAFDQFKKTQPQFKVSNSTLSFAQNKTLFVPAAPEGSTNNWFNIALASQFNTTFTDLNTNTFVTQKNVFEENFLVKDSTRKINWKLTSETRDIAGYTCRRANAVIMDSIYVVAFYTDEIPVSGGPESFSGLPGMILGVALPHENVTWFATKVTDVTVQESALKVPNKGKPVDNKKLRATLESALKSWGDYAQSSYKAFLL
jgi:GLPGLI family protein